MAKVSYTEIIYAHAAFRHAVFRISDLSYFVWGFHSGGYEELYLLE
jgi:hypothetical protein